MNLNLRTCNKVEISDYYLNKEFTFVVREESRDYFFQADSIRERNDWLMAIKSQLSKFSVIYERDEYDEEENWQHPISMAGQSDIPLLM